MKTLTIKVYTARELKRYRPDGYKRAYEAYRTASAMDTFRQDEIIDSLKALFVASGVAMQDWQIGGYGYSYIRPSFGHYDDETGDLSGGRAMAWIENHVLSQYRAPSSLNKEDGNIHTNGDNGKRGRHFRRVYRRWYAPGSLRACPFTGVCYDMDFLDALAKSVKAGDTLRDAFAGLAQEAQKLIEAEAEYDESEAAFLDAADANGYEYDKDGREV